MLYRAFTLIELLIVVAIIAILAAIAVPNFLEAQVRAKVSRAKSDMRTISTGLETYTIDHNRTMTVLTGFLGAPAPGTTGPSLVNSAGVGSSWVSYRFRRLTTPVSYLSQALPDVFLKNGKAKPFPPGFPLEPNSYDTFDYVDWMHDRDISGGTPSGARTSGGNWRLASAGPDGMQAYGGTFPGAKINLLGVDYDPTNGTTSVGDVVRVGGSAPTPPGLLPGINRVTNKYNDPQL